MRKLFKAPTVINMEITDKCNAKCTHCYNFWREDNSLSNSLNREQFDKIVDEFVKAGVFHVVLTGGEPFSNFDLLEYGFKKLTENNISISCNSNLMLTTDDRMQRLKDAGVDHILTSVFSYKAEVVDRIFNVKGAIKKIEEGIIRARKYGIRVSANMVISKENKDDVYKTAEYVHNLGCQKIFGTRVVPSINSKGNVPENLQFESEEAIYVLDQLLKAKEDFGIMIGSLISYPLCLLKDLEKYKDFIGRGCPAGKGHRVSINANGEMHACTHEEDSYANILDEGLISGYQKMRKWHDGSYLFDECKMCPYVDVCNSGCRMDALAYNQEMNAKDHLMAQRREFINEYTLLDEPDVLENIDKYNFIVPKRLRFRKEDGFYLVNIRWANTVTCTNKTAEFLLKYQESGEKFTLADFGADKKDILSLMYFKDVIESDEIIDNSNRSLAGLSYDNIDVF
eukprot:Anaeramoba_flamelloidesa85276_62.p1 GENE.a85276_62~~a85276_62.p1  ORF type:complete len:454 (-),score=32.99 a85276_62:1589-2950(-)